MSEGGKKSDEGLERLLLDIKAYVLLHGSDEALRSALRDGLADSVDEDVRAFVEALQKRRRQGVVSTVLIALGELVLASFLLLAGTFAFVPNLVGVGNPQSFLDYLGSVAYPAFAGSALSQYVAVLEFAVGTGLLLAAFYTLRRASTTLKEAGLEVHTSGA